MPKQRLIVDELPPGAVAQTHRIATLIEVLDPLTGEVLHEIVGEELGREDAKLFRQGGTIGGSVTYDANQLSRATLSLDVVNDGSKDLTYLSADSLLSPYGNEIRVSQGIELADRILLVRLGVFPIDRVRSGADHITRIGARDRFGPLMDAPFTSPWSVASGTNATAAILAVLADAGFSGETDFMAVTVPLPALVEDENGSRADFIAGIAKSIGAELYFGPAGTLRLRPVPSTQGEPVAHFAEGEGGVLLDAEREGDKDKVVNRWKVTGDNPALPENAPIPSAIAEDLEPTSPTRIGGPFNGGMPKSDAWHSPYISKPEQAQDAAEGLLARTIGRPDVIGFNVITDPARRPGDLVRVRREQLEIDEDHLIDTVQVTLGEGAMAGATRAVNQGGLS